MILRRYQRAGPTCSKHRKLKSLLMTNSLTAVAKVFSKTLIFLLQKCELLLLLNCKKILMYLPYFKIEISTSC